MTDQYDPFVEADIEERLLNRESGRATFQEEIGFRASLHAETQPRDMRWWHGLWKSGRGARVG